MPQPENTGASSAKSKRPYRKGNPLSLVERQKALVSRRKETHKEIKVYVPGPLKEQLQEMCKAEGITQTEMIVRLIENANKP